MKFVLLILLSLVISSCGDGSSFNWDKAQQTQALLAVDNPFLGTPANFSGLWNGDCKETSNPKIDCKSILQISQTSNTIDIQLTQVVNYQYQQLPTRSYAISDNSILELSSTGNGVTGLAVGSIGDAAMKIQSQGFSISLQFQNNTKTASTTSSYQYNGANHNITATLKR